MIFESLKFGDFFEFSKLKFLKFSELKIFVTFQIGNSCNFPNCEFLQLFELED